MNTICISEITNKGIIKDVQYQYAKASNYIAKGSIRIIRIKNRSIFLIRTDNIIIMLEQFIINGQMKNMKKIPIFLSLFSKNKFSVLNFSDNLIALNPIQEIEIWSQDRNQNWAIERSLHHNNQLEITDILINYTEDLIISGSKNGNINFWNKNINWRCSQTIEFEKQFQITLNLNKAGNILIVYGEKQQILIYESSNPNDQWVQKQLIKISDYGHACFLKNDVFAYMPERSSKINIYQFSQTVNEFINIQNFDLLVKKFYTGRLQIEYIENLDAILLLRKNLFFLIRKNEKGETLIENLLKFTNDTTQFVCGDDGKYLYTSEQIKENESDYRFIRKLQLRIFRKYEQKFQINQIRQ